MSDKEVSTNSRDDSSERLPADKKLSAAEVERQLLSLSHKERKQIWRRTGRNPDESRGVHPTSPAGSGYPAMAMKHEQVMFSSWHSPIPPSEELERYEAITPGLAHRMMTMAENQSAHRMKLENVAVPEQLRQSKIGQIFAFILGLLAIGGAFALAAFYNQPWVAGVLAGGGTITLALAFLKGKEQQGSRRPPNAHAPQPHTQVPPQSPRR